MGMKEKESVFNNIVEKCIAVPCITHLGKIIATLYS